MKDIFVSFTSADRQWAHWISLELKKLGYAPHVHDWEITLGHDILGWMLERIEKADHVLCVVSEDYLQARYSILERNSAIWRMISEKPGFAWLFVVKPCSIPWIFAHLRRCDLTRLDEPAARARIAQEIAEPEPPETVAFPGAPVPASAPLVAESNVPFSVPAHFLGREAALDKIAAAFAGRGRRIAVSAVHGLRGVGKTTLAAAFADKYRDRYRATWWIRAETESDARADLVGLGVRLGWVGATEAEAAAFERVMDRLRSEGEGLLLIYDNALDKDRLRPFLPKGGAARALITSNSPLWHGVAEALELDVWPKGVGADYLLAQSGRNDARPSAEALSETLGGLPLAHEQAAAYCERRHVSFSEYADRFEAAPVVLLDVEKDAPAEYHNKRTAAKTFALAIEEAAKQHPAAEALLLHAALLAPEPIPLLLFQDGAKAFDAGFDAALAGDGLEEGLAALEAYALVSREEVEDERFAEIKTPCFRLHRLVRAVAAARAEGDARGKMRSALMGAMEAVRPFDAQDARGWPRLRRWVGLAEGLIGERRVEDDTDVWVARMLNDCACYRQVAIGDYGAARPMFERALAVIEKVFGAEHRETMSSLNNLAIALDYQGDHAGARGLHERALAIREKALGPDHPDTAYSLNNLATVLHRQGDFVGARELDQRALAIREKALGPEHRDTAYSLNNLACVLRAQGDITGARGLHERALAIREKALGPEHPETAHSLWWLATLAADGSDLAAARPLFDRAQAIYRKALGPEHPDTKQISADIAKRFPPP